MVYPGVQLKTGKCQIEQTTLLLECAKLANLLETCQPISYNQSEVQFQCPLDGEGASQQLLSSVATAFLYLTSESGCDWH